MQVPVHVFRHFLTAYERYLLITESTSCVRSELAQN